MSVRSALSPAIRSTTRQLLQNPCTFTSTRRSTPFSRSMSSKSSTTPGPVESSMYNKLKESLSPTHLKISNDSASHSHHSAMRAMGGGNGETHFTVEIVSEKFEGVKVIQRHRMVNNLLKEEFEDKGLHALAIKAKSPKECET